MIRLKRFLFLFITLAISSSFIVPVIPGTVGKAEAKQTVKDESLRKGEKRPTLDPRAFGNARIRKAYQVAQEIPWVLDSIYCYCYCKESPTFRHISLLSCYVDTHAAM